jgi:hypothetical protein
MAKDWAPHLEVSMRMTTVEPRMWMYGLSPQECAKQASKAGAWRPAKPLAAQHDASPRRPPRACAAWLRRNACGDELALVLVGGKAKVPLETEGVVAGEVVGVGDKGGQWCD